MSSATTINVVSPTTIWHIGWHALGIAVITESLRWAAAGMTSEATYTFASHTTYTPKERMQEAIAFVQGTALDATLELFGIDQRAEGIREAFHQWIQQQKTPYSP